jgi:hypothetical protein
MLKSRTLLVLSIIFIFIYLATGFGYSFDATQLKHFKSSKQCMSCNLSFADFTGGLNLSSVNLSGTNLSGANLYSAKLTGANLDNVNLSSSTWIDGTKCKPGSIRV